MAIDENANEVVAKNIFTRKIGYQLADDAHRRQDHDVNGRV